ncbi:MAG TPA: polyprenyl synthetase family protein [Polyangia bacterium]|jgi:geranylgeranyl pyrophosphate synthase|nr:polyprenyl synthetase family protein [Polyangia bacterium]
MTTELAAWVSARRAEMDALFARQLDAGGGNGDPGRLVEAMRYSLLAPGKRLRPLLALAAAEAVVGADAMDDSIRLGCAAVELVHCYSLIHDDLPAMDDDDFRRGRPSNHKVFGEATAILAGDALLTLAFEWIAEAGQRATRPGDYLRATLALARGAGMNGMVRGQARDLGETAPTTITGLEQLHAEKTAALFCAALEIGAAVAGADQTQQSALSRFGQRYGIAFQHADDLDDADHVAHAAAARDRLTTLIADAASALEPLGARGDRLRSFAEALLAKAALP